MYKVRNDKNERRRTTNKDNRSVRKSGNQSGIDSRRNKIRGIGGAALGNDILDSEGIFGRFEGVELRFKKDVIRKSTAINEMKRRKVVGS